MSARRGFDLFEKAWAMPATAATISLKSEVKNPR